MALWIFRAQAEVAEALIEAVGVAEAAKIWREEVNV